MPPKNNNRDGVLETISGELNKADNNFYKSNGKAFQKPSGKSWKYQKESEKNMIRVKECGGDGDCFYHVASFALSTPSVQFRIANGKPLDTLVKEGDMMTNTDSDTDGDKNADELKGKDLDGIKEIKKEFKHLHNFEMEDIRKYVAEQITLEWLENYKKNNDLAAYLTDPDALLEKPLTDINNKDKLTPHDVGQLRDIIVNGKLIDASNDGDDTDNSNNNDNDREREKEKEKEEDEEDYKPKRGRGRHKKHTTIIATKKKEKEKERKMERVVYQGDILAISLLTNSPFFKMLNLGIAAVKENPDGGFYTQLLPADRENYIIMFNYLFRGKHEHWRLIGVRNESGHILTVVNVARVPKWLFSDNDHKDLGILVSLDSLDNSERKTTKTKNPLANHPPLSLVDTHINKGVNTTQKRLKHPRSTLVGASPSIASVSTSASALNNVRKLSPSYVIIDDNENSAEVIDLEENLNKKKPKTGRNKKSADFTSSDFAHVASFASFADNRLDNEDKKIKKIESNILIPGILKGDVIEEESWLEWCTRNNEDSLCEHVWRWLDDGKCTFQEMSFRFWHNPIISETKGKAKGKAKAKGKGKGKGDDKETLDLGKTYKVCIPLSILKTAVLIARLNHPQSTTADLLVTVPMDLAEDRVMGRPQKMQEKENKLYFAPSQVARIDKKEAFTADTFARFSEDMAALFLSIFGPTLLSNKCIEDKMDAKRATKPLAAPSICTNRPKDGSDSAYADSDYVFQKMKELGLNSRPDYDATNSSPEARANQVANFMRAVLKSTNYKIDANDENWACLFKASKLVPDIGNLLIYATDPNFL